MADQDSETEKIIKRLRSVENRLTLLESALFISGRDKKLASKEKDQNELTSSHRSEKIDGEDKGLESSIGRYGLAWMGNIVLLFGITFFTQYLIISGHPLISTFIGYLAAGGMIYLATYLTETNEHLAFIFKMNGHILLFYLTTRLHFFSPEPLLTNKTLSIALLLILVALQVYLAIRNKSQAFATLSVIFTLTTAFLGDTTHLTLPLVVFTAGGAVYYSFRFNWRALLFVTIVLTYFSFFLWLFGNPFMGHPMQLIKEQHMGIIYLFVLGASYSLMLMSRLADESADDYLVGLTFVNGILFTLFLLVTVLRFYPDSYVTLFSIIALSCLVYSVILHSRSDWNFASAYYSLYGFMAMSIALYGLFGFPKVYLVLAVQSLVVVSLALWFRNRLIVVMNSLLFLTILLIYFFLSDSVDSINFSFALIALISARIINWSRSRLRIETDLIRNLYLTLGFFMVLYALVHAVPKHFVTLSWTMAALVYFLLSFILKNVKYRYMALGTMICASFYLFIIDLSKIELIFRVLALLFLAAISIGISIYYTNRNKKSEN